MQIGKSTPHPARTPSEPATSPGRPRGLDGAAVQQVRQAVSAPLAQPHERQLAASMLLLNADLVGNADDFYSLTLALAQSAGGEGMTPADCASLVKTAMDLHASGQLAPQRLREFISGLAQGMGGPELPPPLSQAIVEAIAWHPSQDLAMAHELLSALGLALGASEAAEPGVTAAVDAVQHGFVWVTLGEQDSLLGALQEGRRQSLPEAAASAQPPQLPQRDHKHGAGPKAAASSAGQVSGQGPVDSPAGGEIEDVRLERDSPLLRQRLAEEEEIRFGQRSAIDEFLAEDPDQPA